VIVWPTVVQKKVKNKQMKSISFDSIYKLPKNIKNTININLKHKRKT